MVCPLGPLSQRRKGYAGTSIAALWLPREPCHQHTSQTPPAQLCSQQYLLGPKQSTLSSNNSSSSQGEPVHSQIRTILYHQSADASTTIQVKPYPGAPQTTLMPEYLSSNARLRTNPEIVFGSYIEKSTPPWFHQCKTVCPFHVNLVMGHVQLGNDLVS